MDRSLYIRHYLNGELNPPQCTLSWWWPFSIDFTRYRKRKSEIIAIKNCKKLQQFFVLPVKKVASIAYSNTLAASKAARCIGHLGMPPNSVPGLGHAQACQVRVKSAMLNILGPLYRWARLEIVGVVSIFAIQTYV